MKITIERPLDKGELKVVEEVLEEAKEMIEKDDKKTRKEEDDFELWFF